MEKLSISFIYSLFFVTVKLILFQLLFLFIKTFKLHTQEWIALFHLKQMLNQNQIEKRTIYFTSNLLGALSEKFLFLFLLLVIPARLFRVEGMIYSGTSARCLWTLTVWRALSCLSTWRSVGLSSKYVWKFLVENVNTVTQIGNREWKHFKSNKQTFNFWQLNISCLISFSLASLTAILVTALQASLALYLKASTSSNLNWYDLKISDWYYVILGLKAGKLTWRQIYPDLVVFFPRLSPKVVSLSY